MIMIGNACQPHSTEIPCLSVSKAVIDKKKKYNANYEENTKVIPTWSIFILAPFPYILISVEDFTDLDVLKTN